MPSQFIESIGSLGSDRVQPEISLSTVLSLKRTKPYCLLYSLGFSRLWGMQSDHRAQRFTHVIHCKVKRKCIPENESKGFRVRQVLPRAPWPWNHPQSEKSTEFQREKKSWFSKKRNNMILVDSGTLFVSFFFLLSSEKCSLLNYSGFSMGKM